MRDPTRASAEKQYSYTYVGHELLKLKGTKLCEYWFLSLYLILILFQSAREITSDILKEYFALVLDLDNRLDLNTITTPLVDIPEDYGIFVVLFWIVIHLHLLQARMIEIAGGANYEHCEATIRIYVDKILQLLSFQFNLTATDITHQILPERYMNQTIHGVSFTGRSDWTLRVRIVSRFIELDIIDGEGKAWPKLNQKALLQCVAYAAMTRLDHIQKKNKNYRYVGFRHKPAVLLVFSHRCRWRCLVQHHTLGGAPYGLDL